MIFLHPFPLKNMSQIEVGEWHCATVGASLVITMCIRGELDMVDFLEHLHHLLPPRSTWRVAGHSEGNHRFLRGWQRPLISLNVCWWEIWPGFTVDWWVWIRKLQGVGAPWCRVFQAALWRSCEPVKITKIRLSYWLCVFSSCIGCASVG